jgi:hypothetical protein
MSLARRDFIQRLLTVGAACAVPWAPGVAAAAEARFTGPIRVRGIVRAGGRGLRRVRVSDGVSVVATDAAGRFELIAAPGQTHVFVVVPAGYEIPVGPSGTAHISRPIRPDARGEMLVAFELQPLRRSDETHAFLYLADPQTATRAEMARFHAETLPDVRETLRGLSGPIFGITAGDIVSDAPELYFPYEDGIGALGVPFFQAVGNHDLDLSAGTDEGSTTTYERHFGARYYSFDRGAVHYVVLDTVFWFGGDFIGYLPASQLAWLAADLAHVERGGRVVVTQHVPALTTRHARRGQKSPSAHDTVANRAELYRLLEPYEAIILSAHAHENEHVTDGAVYEHVHGAVCGAWWSGPVCPDGTPLGYGVYEVRGEEVRWRYKSTGLAAGHQLRVYPHGADPTAPDQIVANVWDWDPTWKVTYYENGERKGEMTRRPGLDPLARQLYAGPKLPVELPAVEPLPTNHLFVAPAARGATVRVEVVDRFGRIHSDLVPPPER